MDTQTTLDNGKLSSYYFATTWAITCVEARIKEAQQYGWPTQYDAHQLETLRDMEQFFKMGWDCWMEQLTGHTMEQLTGHTMEEVTHG